jgi:tetratricopeptide (TPR) repeat protein
MKNKNFPVIIGLFFFLFVFIVYLTALSPTIYSRDNPEIITAAATLGIAHSPGYPLFTILGYCFTKIIPFGTIPFKVNLMSALFSAGAVFLVYLIILRITKNLLAGLFGAAVLAFSYNYFLQSLSADVLSLNNFLVALSILILLFWRETKRIKYLYLFAFIYGLAFSHHQISFLLFPAFLYFVWVTDKKILISWEFPKLIGFFALGLLPYIYLPIRALQHPVYMWGEPQTLKGFLEMISRREYTGYDFSYIGYFYFRIWDYITSLSWKQFTILGFGLGSFGLYGFKKKDNVLFVFLLLLVLLSGVGFAFFANVTPNWTEIAYARRFYIFSFMIFSIGIGLSGLWLIERFKKLSFLILFFPLILLILHYPQVNQRNYYYGYDLGKNILKSLPPNSVLFAGSDVPFFELLYFQVVEKERPDVRILPGADKELIELPKWRTERILKEWPDWQLSIDELALKYPVYTTTNTEEFWGIRAGNFIPEGLVYRYSLDKNWVNNFDPQKAEENLKNYTYRGQYNTEKIRDDFTKEIVYFYSNAWTNLGMALHKKKMYEQAASKYQKALEIVPDNLIAWTNYAGTLLDRQMYKEAKEEYRKILKKYPNSETAKNGLRIAEQKLFR